MADQSNIKGPGPGNLAGTTGAGGKSTAPAGTTRGDAASDTRARNAAVPVNTAAPVNSAAPGNENPTGHTGVADPHDPAAAPISTPPEGPITSPTGGVIGATHVNDTARREKGGQLTPGAALADMPDEPERPAASKQAQVPAGARELHRAKAGEQLIVSVIPAAAPEGPSRIYDRAQAPGGLYHDSRGRWKNAEGQRTDESGTVLTAKQIAKLDAADEAEE